MYLVPSDTLYEERCSSPNLVIIIDPTLDVVDMCSLRFLSEILPTGEQVILINGTAYRIAKRKDDTTILRKMN
jgi:hypothetical protein